MSTIIDNAGHQSAISEELSGTLTLLLNRYLQLLTEDHGDFWSRQEEQTVLQVRDVLTRAGHAPYLPHEVRAHIDYPFFGKNR
ncbi:MAG: hypothetical protein H7145_21385 [Akkermansiaceae bacterium]|nr:hypothetical protein [Armatimonadota bacterium]